MSVKFTTTEQEGEIRLLFEFLDKELPEGISVDYMTELAKNKFAGSLQTNQIQGIYLEPLMIKGQFYGSMVASDGSLILAKDRSDQLGRLQGRPVKFFFEKFKQIVIIESYKRNIKNFENVEYEIVLMPHDFQVAPTPSQAVQLKERSAPLAGIAVKDKEDPLFDEKLADLESKLSDVPNEVKPAGNIVDPSNNVTVIEEPKKLELLSKATGLENPKGVIENTKNSIGTTFAPYVIEIKRRAKVLAGIKLSDLQSEVSP